MIFEVEVITTSVKKVRINANNAAQAKLLAKHKDEHKRLAKVAAASVKKDYKAYCKCSLCGRRTSLFYTSDDESQGYCMPCYEVLVKGNQKQLIS